jgi:uncharacterized membrane protein
MRKKFFSIEETLRFAWDMMRDNIGLFFKIFLVNLALAAIHILNGIFFGTPEGNLSTTGGFFSILLSFLEVIINLGFLGIFLNLHDKKDTSIDDIFSKYKMFFRYLAASVLYALIVLGGLLLLIVPGIIWGIKFRYFRYLIVDKNLGPIAALKKSAEITQGAKLDLYIFGLIAFVLQILGLMTFGVGLFFIVPVIWMAETFIYRKLVARK